MAHQLPLEVHAASVAGAVLHQRALANPMTDLAAKLPTLLQCVLQQQMLAWGALYTYLVSCHRDALDSNVLAYCTQQL